MASELASRGGRGHLSQLVDKLTDALGGPARRRAVVMLGCVLSLQTADGGTIGGVADQLERSFHIGNTQLGLLITASQLLLAVAALPLGVLTDRTNRVRLLAITIALWTVAMAASGLATSFTMLLVTRVGLGLVTAAAGPVVASLTGDFFPAEERSRIYGMILTGELLGSGIGLLISTDIADLAGWRAPFFVLASFSIVLAYALKRLLPEPARGGQSRLRTGDTRIKSGTEVQQEHDNQALHRGCDRGMAASAAPVEDSEVRHRARQRDDIQPRPRLVLQRHPNQLSPWAAALYVLRIPSNLVFISSSVLNYFFLSGVATFAVVFAVSRYRIDQALVGLIFLPIGGCAVVGTLLGGRLVDALIPRGRLDARPLVAGLALVGAALVFWPGLYTTSLAAALPVFCLAAALLTAANPALYAGRLDVVPSRMWGRSEAVRSFTQSLFQAAAPISFGYVSSLLGGPRARFGAGVNNTKVAARVSIAEGHALALTFMIMLAPLATAGVLLVASRRTYLRDVATADASEKSGATALERGAGVAPEKK